MGQTYVEALFAKAVENNAVAMGTKNCDVIVLTGPLRISARTPQGLITLAMTALQGASFKEIAKNVVPAVPANFTVPLTAANRYCALLIRVTGSKNAYKQADVLLTVTGTGMTTSKVAISPHSNKAEALLLLTNDNGGVGQISAPTVVVVSWLVADHPEAAGLEYAINVEGISLRDFTDRSGTH